MVTIRQCDYTPDIHAADVAAFGDSYALSCPDAIWWDARDGRRLAGFCGLEIERGERIGFLCRAWVSPKYRGRRVQARMIRARESAARKAGLVRMVTYTSHGNCQSANSLIRCGYRMYTPEWAWGLDYCNYWFKVL